MADYVFGKSIDYIFTPLINGEPVDDVQSLVTARIYSTGPTNDQIDNTDPTGFDEEITTWTELNLGERKITFSALTDSNPHSATPYETYWTAIRFRFESSGPIVFDTETIRIYRPDSWTSKITAGLNDLLVFEPELEDLRSTFLIEQAIQKGIGRVFRRLEGMGYKKARLYTLSQLNDAVVFQALTILSLGLARENTQSWLTKYEEYKGLFEEVWGQTRLELIDSSNLDHRANDSTSLETARLKQVNLIR